MSSLPHVVDRIDERSSPATGPVSATPSAPAPGAPADPSWDQVGWTVCLGINRRQLEQEGFTFLPAEPPVTQDPSTPAEPPS